MESDDAAARYPSPCFLAHSPPVPSRRDREVSRPRITPTIHTHIPLEVKPPLLKIGVSPGLVRRRKLCPEPPWAPGVAREGTYRVCYSVHDVCLRLIATRVGTRVVTFRGFGNYLRCF